MICVFDCETIPDSALLRKIYSFEGSDFEVSLNSFKDQEKLFDNGSLPIIFHKIISISAVIADDFGKFQKVNTIEAESEKELISKFISFVNSKNPRLVSFNGRNFHIPLILIRSMKYNLSFPSFYEVENKELGKSKWEGHYRERYSGKFSFDLLDHMSEFGSVRGLKLHSLCASLNLPGNYNVTCNDVLNLYYENKIDKIKEHCESDALNIYWLFLKYELLRGNLNLDDYINYLCLMKEYLNSFCFNKSYKNIFDDYIDDEMFSSKNKNVLQTLNLKKASEINQTPVKKIIKDDNLPEIDLSNLED